MAFTYLGFCVSFYALGHITELIYTQILKRPFYAYSTRNLIDFVIFVFFFAFIWVTYYKNLSGTWKENASLNYETTAEIYVYNYVKRSDEAILLERILLICCSIIMWLRVLFMLHYNTYIGQLSGVLKHIVKEVVIFFCFFII
jgi:hypothetical protein